MLSNTKHFQFPDTYYVQVAKRKSPIISELKGPKRVVKLFIFCALLPSLLLIVPLYLRFRVYIQQTYPIGVSDMRIVDNKISTTWCQNQLITANTTFNAYVIAHEPEISKHFENVNMRRSFVLKDGAKEYWGFYLLEGSLFTVSTCVRWPGASLIVIEGHRNLKECAYIGDNSSEETDTSVSSEENSNITVINRMTKLIPNVILNKRNSSESKQMSFNDANKKISNKIKNIHLNYAEELYQKGEKKNKQQSIQSKNDITETNDAVEALKEIVNKLKSLGPRGKMILQKLRNDSKNEDQSTEILHHLDKIMKEMYPKNNQSKSVKKELNNENEFNKLRKEILYHRMKSLKLDVDNETNAAMEVFDDTDKADVHGTIKQNKSADQSKSEFWSSFSSSEERLLECKGLLVSLPLIPNHMCDQKFNKNSFDEVSGLNSISYRIQTTGYYFFIFNNENEVETNFIHTHFELKKAVYNISKAVASCKNQTKECSLPLSFWSRERTILELPYPKDDILWNEEFEFTSKCEPRSILYFICMISVPFCIFIFAFS